MKKLSRVGRQKDRVAIWIPKLRERDGNFATSFKMTVNNRAIIYAANELIPCWWETYMCDDMWEHTYKYMDFGGYLK